MDIFKNRGNIEVSLEEAERFLGESFVRTVNHIKNIALANECFCLIHGTTLDSCIEIINDENGLIHYDNDYTSTMSSFSSLEDLYNCGLVNGILPNGFIVLVIPKKCLIGTDNLGLWHSLVKDSLSQDFKIDDLADETLVEKYSIPREYIIGMIDLENKQIIQNKHFDLKYRNNNLVFDAHVLGSFKFLRESSKYFNDSSEKRHI